jgi:DnaJ like chaperone protein
MIFIRRIKKRNSIIKEESTEKEINVEQNWISDFGEGLADFIGSVLINKIVVTAFQAYKISEKWPEIIKDIYKKHKGFCEEDDKALNAGIGSGEVEEDTDEDISQETDNNSYEEAPSETAVNDLESAYNILGISENASIEEIKSAYRKKMMEYHPDRTGGLGEKLRVLAEEEAKKINNAYEKIMKEKGAA